MRRLVPALAVGLLALGAAAPALAGPSPSPSPTHAGGTSGGGSGGGSTGGAPAPVAPGPTASGSRATTPAPAHGVTSAQRAAHHATGGPRVHVVHHRVIPATPIQVLPPLAHIVVVFDGRRYETDHSGIIHIRITDWRNVPQRLQAPVSKQLTKTTRLSFARWSPTDLSQRRKRIFAFMNEQYLWAPSYFWGTWTDRSKPPLHPVSPAVVQRMTMRSLTGDTKTFTSDKPKWLTGIRYQPSAQGPYGKDVTWSVQSAYVRGSNVAQKGYSVLHPCIYERPWNHYCEPFQKNPKRRVPAPWHIKLRFYSARFSSSDALFGSSAGDGIRLTFPDGKTQFLPFDRSGIVYRAALPAGSYTVSVSGLGMSTPQPVALSKNQVVAVKMLTYVDIAVVLGVLLAIALGTIAIGRPHVYVTAWNAVTRPFRAKEPTTVTAQEGETAA